MGGTIGRPLPKEDDSPSYSSEETPTQRSRAWTTPLTSVLVKTRSVFSGSTVVSYTVDELEQNLYDNKHHTRGTGKILMSASMLQCECDEEDCPPFLVRCIRDRIAVAVDYMVLATVLVTCICSPLTFIWGSDMCDPMFEPFQRSLVRLDMAMDAIYSAYMVYLLNVSFLHRTQRFEIVSRRKILRRHLLSPYYWLRLLSTTPYFFIVKTCRFGLLLNNVKAIRIFCFVYMPDSLWRWRDTGARAISPVHRACYWEIAFYKGVTM